MINVVVPVHLGGGAILPGESGGNNIGTFVAKCPGAMEERRYDNAKEGAVVGREGGGDQRRWVSDLFACTSRSRNRREVPPPSCGTASQGSAPTAYRMASRDRCCTALIKATLSPFFTSLAIVTDCLIVKVALHPPPMPPSPSPPLFLLATSKSPPNTLSINLLNGRPMPKLLRGCRTAAYDCCSSRRSHCLWDRSSDSACAPRQCTPRPLAACRPLA